MAVSKQTIAVYFEKVDIWRITTIYFNGTYPASMYYTFSDMQIKLKLLKINKGKAFYEALV